LAGDPAASCCPADGIQALEQIADRLVAEAVILGVAYQKIADLQVRLEILIALER
jgi:hypothetical protein